MQAIALALLLAVTGLAAGGAYVRKEATEAEATRVAQEQRQEKQREELQGEVSRLSGKLDEAELRVADLAETARSDTRTLKGLTVTGKSGLGDVAAESLRVAKSLQAADGTFGTVVVRGAAAIGQGLKVDGPSALKELTVSGAVRLTGDADDLLLLQPSVDRGQKVLVVRSPSGSEAASLSTGGHLVLNGTAQANLLTDGTATLSAGNLAGLTGLSVASGGASVTGTLRLDGDLSVSGDTTFSNLGPGYLKVGPSGLLSSSVLSLDGIEGVLPVTSGGTGATSLGANGILFGGGNSAVQATAPGTPGQVLVAGAAGAPAFTSLSGDGTLAATGAFTLAATGVTAGTYGTGTQVPQYTVDSKGRIVSASHVTITGAAPTGPASGDLDGNYPSPAIAANAVTGAKILNDTITAADLASGDFSSKVTSGTYSISISGNSATVSSGAGIAAGSIANSSLANSGITVTAGTGLSGGGTVSLGGSVSLANAGVTSLNALTGGISIAGAGINTVSASGSTVTVTGTEADTFAAVTARGASTATALTLTGGASVSSGLSVSGGLDNNAGGITNAGAISGAASLTASGTIQGAVLNVTSTINLNGTSINTGGTLSNVAYLDQANVFSASGTALTVTNAGRLGSLAIGTAPTAAQKLLVNGLSTADSLAQAAVGTGAAANKGLVIQGSASQSANLQEWQNSSGTALTYINSSGEINLDRRSNNSNVRMRRADGQFIIEGAYDHTTYGTILQSSINAGSTAPYADLGWVSTIKGDAQVKLNVGASTYLYVQNGASAGVVLGGTLYSPYAGTMQLKGNTTQNAAGTVQFSFDTDAALTAAGAKLVSFKNNGTEKAYIDKDGNAYFPNLQTTATGSTFTSAVSITGTASPQLSVKYDGSNYYTTAVSSAGAVTFDATGASAAFVFSDAVSVPGAGANSERFGAGATATGTSDLAVGMNAAASGGNSLAIGQGSSSGDRSTVVGRAATASGGAMSVSIGYLANTDAAGQAVAIGESSIAASRSVGIGRVATTAATHSIALGFASTVGASGQYGTSLGASSSVNFLRSIALGYGATATAANQMVVGSTGAAINTVFFGKGATDASPTAYTIQGTGGTGTNIAGAGINIAGGQGTGTGAGGSISLQVAKPGSTGPSANALSTVMSLSGTDGSALFKNSANSTTAFQVQPAASTTPVFTVDTSNRNVGVSNTLSVGDGTGASQGITISSNTYAQLILHQAGTMRGYLESNGSDLHLVGNGVPLSLQASGANAVTISSNGSERLRVASDGAVGIGSTGPDRRLDVLDASNPQLRLTHTDGSIYTDFLSNSSGNLTINPSGGTITAAASLQAASGTASAPTYSFSSESNSGLYRIASGTIGLSVSGTRFLSVDNQGNTRFGTGGTGYSGSVTIDNGSGAASSGQLQISGNNGTGVISASVSGANNAMLGFDMLYGGWDNYARAATVAAIKKTSNKLAIQGSGGNTSGSIITPMSDLLTVNLTDGNVGIGASSATARLHIAGNGSSASWSTSGVSLQSAAATYTDTSGSGSIATRVGSSFGIPTFASSSAVSLTDAATLYIAGSPSAGTNTSITNAHALLIQTGSASSKGITVRAAASQTANILEVQDSNGNVLARVNNDGRVKAAGFDPSLTTKTANYTLATTDGVVLGDATSGVITFTLPTAVGKAGTTYTMKKVDVSSNKVAVATTGGQTIDGAASYDLLAQYNLLTVISDGSNWSILFTRP